MKKIAFIMFAFLAIQFAEAQKTPTLKAAGNPKEIALNEINELAKIVQLDDKMKENFHQVFLMRAEEVNNASTAEEKKKIYEMYGEKIVWGLTPEQRKLLESNRGFYERLTVYKG